MNDLIVLENGNPVLKNEYVNYLLDLKQKENQIKEELSDITDKLLADMEANKVLKIDIPELAINYIAPTDRETFDSKRFKEEHSDLYDEYIKMSPVKSSIRIKLK